MISPHRTRAVVNVARNQTVLNIAGVDQFPQPGSLTDQVQRYSQETTLVEGVNICEKLFGTSQYNNIFLMGVAYQRGYLPLSAASIEQAIRLNGKIIEANLAAFRWGRIYVSDRKRLEAQLTTPPPKTAAELAEHNKGYLRRERNGETLVAAYERLLAKAPHIDDEMAYTMAGWLSTLLQFQDESYAQTYLDFVNQVYQQDRAGYGLTKVVAHNLARLMQIKDEFEVARLALSQEEQDRVRVEYHLKSEDRVEITYVLDPPWLRFLKCDQGKVHLSPRFQTRLLFGLLRRLKPLRGFAVKWSDIRRFEFGLISWYRELIEQILPCLTDANYSQAISIANRARGIVGYDEIKLKNWQRIEVEVTQDLTRFKEPATAKESLIAV
jgi:indolepyruvate ferredoxin oxidoreductase